ncbi:unnamed protein product [Protopolystoma xenopodis]|uniref:Uncharacterized protein n=1 Tax=Protopolystoma xenopodis TaxID=117903 RepID=A0A3S5FGF3_9PLAT|nr:unnamed protein product [Protopolystoma xenopodis]
MFVLNERQCTNFVFFRFSAFTDEPKLPEFWSVVPEYPDADSGQDTSSEMDRRWRPDLMPEEILVRNLLQRGSLTVRPNGQDNLTSVAVRVNITYNVIQILAFVS